MRQHRAHFFDAGLYGPPRSTLVLHREDGRVAGGPRPI